jgi:hypothetical protein
MPISKPFEGSSWRDMYEKPGKVKFKIEFQKPFMIYLDSGMEIQPRLRTVAHVWGEQEMKGSIPPRYRASALPLGPHPPGRPHLPVRQHPQKS